MRIAFVVNNLESLEPGNSTLRLALEASNSGHSVWVVPSSRFRLDEDDRILASGVSADQKRSRSTKIFLSNLKKSFDQLDDITISDFDVLFLRANPFKRKFEKKWINEVGIFFGRLAMRDGVQVVNNPDGLAKAENESYLNLFPQIVRPVNLITRDKTEIREFARKYGKIILRPLKWSPDQEEFVITEEDWHNLNQIVESLAKDGYILAQEFIAETSQGYVQLLMLDGKPLRKRGRYACFYVRKNGEEKTFEALQPTEEVLSLAETVSPKLLEDGIFFAGLKIAGHKIIEINVFCPSGIDVGEDFEKVNFSADVIASLEQKVNTLKCYGHDFASAEVSVGI